MWTKCQDTWKLKQIMAKVDLVLILNIKQANQNKNTKYKRQKYKQIFCLITMKSQIWNEMWKVEYTKKLKGFIFIYTCWWTSSMKLLYGNTTPKLDIYDLSDHFLVI